MIAKPGNKTAALSWPDPYDSSITDSLTLCAVDSQHKGSVVQSFKGFFAPNLDKHLNKQPYGLQNKTP